MENSTIPPVQPQAPAVAIPSQAVPTPHHTPVWLMLLMLFVFPPLGWFFMWKEKSYHLWFATTIFIYGLFGFVLNAVIIVYVMPHLSSIYSGLGIAQGSTLLTSKYMLVLGILISDAMMFFGIYLWYYIKKHGVLDGRLLIITAVLLAINYFVPTISAIISLSWVISTAYEVVNAVGYSQ